MGSLQRFEEIEAWKKARSLTQEIYRTSSSGEFARDYGLKDQVRRAAVSIMSNITEGFERDGNKEFLQFLSIAKGSAGEVKAQLYVALDAGYLTTPQFIELYEVASQTDRLIGGFMKYLQQSEMRGSKPNAAQPTRNQELGTRNRSSNGTD